MTMFHVGQKVTLKSDRPLGKGYPIETSPKFGVVYTIRDISEYDSDIGLRLVEIINPILPYRAGMLECNFWAECFRPVVSRPTDISIFTAMLVPRTMGVPTDA